MAKDYFWLHEKQTTARTEVVAGVDMTITEPFSKTTAVMYRTMDEIESLLDKEKSTRR
jgi:hypothetical protein